MKTHMNISKKNWEHNYVADRTVEDFNITIQTVYKFNLGPKDVMDLKIH